MPTLEAGKKTIYEPSIRKCIENYDQNKREQRNHMIFLYLRPPELSPLSQVLSLLFLNPFFRLLFRFFYFVWNSDFINVCMYLSLCLLNRGGIVETQLQQAIKKSIVRGDIYTGQIEAETEQKHPFSHTHN